MTNDRTFTFTWTLDAPAAEVFRAWTEPDRLDWFYNDTMPVPDRADRARPARRRRLAPADGDQRVDRVPDGRCLPRDRA